MPTIDSTIQAIAVQFPLLVLFFFAFKWLVERQDKIVAAKDTAHQAAMVEKDKLLAEKDKLNAEREKTLAQAFQIQLREQKEQHEKEYVGAIQRYEVIASKVLEVVGLSGESMRVLNKTVESFTNLRSLDEKLNTMIKEAEKR